MSVCHVSRLNHFVPPFFSLFLESVDHQTGREGERVRERHTKSTLGLSKWFKRDVRGLQHMVGSDFLMQIGKDQIKAAWQPINQPSNQTWQLSIMTLSSPQNPIVCSKIVYLKEKRREEKSSEVGLSLPCLCKRSYAHGSNTHKAPLCTPRAHSFLKTAFICCVFYSYESNVVPVRIRELLGNNRRRKFTAVNSSAGTRVAVKSDCRIAAKLHPLRKLNAGQKGGKN